MSLMLTCECYPRFIFHSRSGPVCSKCGIPAEEGTPQAKHRRQLDVDYDCPVTGKPIRSKRAHEENLKIHGCHVLEKGEKDQAERNRKAADTLLEEKVAQTAAELVHALPEDKKTQLAHELLTSEIEITRGAK